MGLLRKAVQLGSADRDRSNVSRTSSTSASTLTPSNAGSDFEREITPRTSDGKACAPALHEFFQSEDVQSWEGGRFRLERTMRAASKKTGSSEDHMLDALTGLHVSVRHRPNEWIRECHERFAQERPDEVERPWVDIGCTAYLTEINFPYVRPLLGVYRDGAATRVVTELAPEGDLLGWLGAFREPPGAAREALVRPIAEQLVQAVKQLHELSIVHRGLSAQSVAISRQGGLLTVQLSGFGLATRSRFVTEGGCCYRGGLAPVPPEAHSGEAYDGFLADGFAVGVLIYGLLTGEYPWTSTVPGGCKAFGFCGKRGFRAFAARRKCFGQTERVAELLSEPALRLLEGLLATDPAQRLTLGESACFEGGQRSSALEEPWLRGLPA